MADLFDIEDGSTLNGPDSSKAAPPEGGVVEQVGDRLDMWAWQFCNRWVFLEHQRPHALKELRELISEARRGAE